MRGRPLRSDQIEQILGFHESGKPARAIASDLGLDRKTVEGFLKRHHEKTLERLAEKSRSVKGGHLARLEWMIKEACAAWVDSRKPARSREKKTESLKEDGDKIYKQVNTSRSKNQAGDPRFLTVILELQREQRRILGIDKEETPTTATPLQIYLPANKRDRADLEAATEAIETTGTENCG